MSILNLLKSTYVICMYLGTVLYGPNPEPANNEKRFRLELFYTEINN